MVNIGNGWSAYIPSTSFLSTKNPHSSAVGIPKRIHRHSLGIIKEYKTRLPYACSTYTHVLWCIWCYVRIYYYIRYVSQKVGALATLGHDCFEQDQLSRGADQEYYRLHAHPGTGCTSPFYKCTIYYYLLLSQRILYTLCYYPYITTLREDCRTFPPVGGCRGQNRDNVTAWVFYTRTNYVVLTVTLWNQTAR